MRCAALLLAAVLLVSPSAHADDVEEGVAALRAGNTQRAVNAWTDLARIGNPAAITNLAVLYLTGTGVERDVSLALQLLGAASDFGFPVAQYNLAKVHANAVTFGVALPDPVTRTTEMYRAAAHGGHVRAQMMLGIRTYLGIGTPRDPAGAAAWLSIARTAAEPDTAAEIDALLAAALAGMTAAQMADAIAQRDAIVAHVPPQSVRSGPLPVPPTVVAALLR